MGEKFSRRNFKFPGEHGKGFSGEYSKQGGMWIKYIAGSTTDPGWVIRYDKSQECWCAEKRDTGEHLDVAAEPYFRSIFLEDLPDNEKQWELTQYGKDGNEAVESGTAMRDTCVRKRRRLMARLERLEREM